ncbi:substrate-binding domain-containing protein [Mycolicibacterium fallax]|uniref:Uncharacterized protein n=1 Tax=Mycolicibacterium fallax TaxID=1793 RepID=A0A1X1RDP0_MYCFA|nr:substrate-binding domain-containing protein [Mycolicibacterium fallax]ORV03462.1 hypothetical protein AWC04_10110 [Mycolicibacterium fallax]BBY97362.1 hypothetical protein MFAL_08290 [Mycolicibacterium fallax]
MGRHSVPDDDDSTAPGDEFTAPGEEFAAPGDEFAAPGEEFTAPDDAEWAESDEAVHWARSGEDLSWDDAGAVDDGSMDYTAEDDDSEDDPADVDYAGDYGDRGAAEYAEGDFAGEYADDYSDGDYSDDDYADYPDTGDTYSDYADGTPEAPEYTRAAAAAPVASRSHRSDGELTGSHRIVTQGRRGVSRGVVVALITVVAVVGVFILWRFFAGVLDDRNTVAAGNCLEGDVKVAVVADPAIAGVIAEFAEQFNAEADPVGDHCPAVAVLPADSRTVTAGLVGEWPADLGDQPALWIPGSTASVARVQAALGPQLIASSTSLASSPVLLAVRPELKEKLGDQNWSTLPGLQTAPGSLDGLGLPGWGSLRLALPVIGDSDAAFLAAEAISAADPAGGAAGVRTLVSAQPEAAGESADTAFDALLDATDSAAAPVHAVVTTEQRLFQRATDLSDPGASLAGWLPPGPVAVADFPAVQFKGDWLTGEQMSATSQFERYLAAPDRQSALANAGFRVKDQPNPDSTVVDFGASIDNRVPVGDDAARATLANVLDAPAGGATTSIMLDRSLDLGAVRGALNARLGALSPASSVGLTTFDGGSSTTAVTVGPLSDEVDGAPRRDTLIGTLDGMSASGGGAVSFTTLRNVLDEARIAYQPGQVNSVLVITSGPHTDQSLGAEGLQELVRSSVDPAKPIQINVINVGDDPDRPTWESVAQISGGSFTAVPASDSPEFATALDRLLS